jgi:hypothetical protein
MEGKPFRRIKMKIGRLLSIIISLALAGCAALPQDPSNQETPPVPQATPTAQSSLPPESTPPVELEPVSTPDPEGVERPAEGQATPQLPVTNEEDSKLLAKLPAGLLIAYHLNGGLAGLDETWMIFADGRITNSDQLAGQVEPEAAAGLAAAIQALGFFDLQSSYLPANTCCDRFGYEITLIVDGRAHQVSALEAEPGVPEAFWQAVKLIKDFLSAHTTP